jgi:hypothetical protein
MSIRNSWQELFDSLRILVDEPEWGVSTEDEIVAFEQRNNIVLPSDYRNFCKILGSGVASNWLEIYCPGCSLLTQSQEGLALTIDYIRQFPSENPETDQQKIDVLANSFTFADDAGSHFLLWDLRTYRDEDCSYDIYWAVWDSPESEDLETDLRFVGRSFFEFVRDFCYGSRRTDLYPSGGQRVVEYTYRRLRT